MNFKSITDWITNNKENIKLVIKILLIVILIIILIVSLSFLIQYIFPPKVKSNSNTSLPNSNSDSLPKSNSDSLPKSNSDSLPNKIEISLRGQTGNEEYSIESITGDILVPKRIAPKEGEIISFETNLPNIILNRFRSKNGGEFYIIKIEKNKNVLKKNKLSSVIRGDLQFTTMTDENGKIERQQAVNEGKLKWPTKYQIDIGE